MKLSYFQRGFNYSQDGPGNRLVYHLYGCNFRCPWCSNPECFAPDTKVTTLDVEDVFKEIMSCRPMFYPIGGVTFTGGEPTLQMDALLELCKKLKEANITIAMECNASHKRLKELLPYIDFLMMDLKQTDGERHKEIVGFPNEMVLENIKYIASTRQLALRIPLVNGYNTDDKTIDGFISFLNSFERHKDFTLELLSYHEYGKVKWKQHNMEYTVKGGFVPKELYNEIEKKFNNANIKTIHT